MFRSGVALSMGTWQMSPVNRPMTSAWPTFGRVMMMARQYMAMMKFGFMPIEESSDPTVSLSTAPAANSTAMRIRSCVVSPVFFCDGAATSRLRAPPTAAPAAWGGTSLRAPVGAAVVVAGAVSRLICCSMFLIPFLAEAPPVVAPPGASGLPARTSEEDHSLRRSNKVSEEA